MLPHRLTPAAGSLQAGITGFLPIQAFNSVILSGFSPFVKGFPALLSIFQRSARFFHGSQQFLGRYAEELRQRQQVGGTGIGSPRFP